MKKVYISAKYRIEDVIFNDGYICIDENCIIGIFTLDWASIEICNGKLHFYLDEYEPLTNSHSDTIEFISTRYIDMLESPQTYILKSSDNDTLTLSLLNKITDPKKIADIEELFKPL